MTDQPPPTTQSGSAALGFAGYLVVAIGIAGVAWSFRAALLHADPVTYWGSLAAVLVAVTGGMLIGVSWEDGNG